LANHRSQYCRLKFACQTCVYAREKGTTLACYSSRTCTVTALIKHLALNCGNLEGMDMKSPLDSLHFRVATQDEQ
jgi:hypothetical protein